MDSVKFHVRHEHTKIGTKNSVPTLCSMAWLGGWISAKASSVRNGSRASSRVPLLTSPNRDPTRLRRAIAGSDPGVGNEKRQTKRSDDFHGSGGWISLHFVPLLRLFEKEMLTRSLFCTALRRTRRCFALQNWGSGSCSQKQEKR